MEMKNRCAWVNVSDPLMTSYHDLEWGKPVHDDSVLLEFIILEGAQAGLNWRTVLLKRENYRAAFDSFDPVKIADYDVTKIKELMTNPGIIRNELKIRSAINNAMAFLKVQREFGSFDSFLWNTDRRFPIVNGWKESGDIPSRSVESDKISRDLESRGFTFVGTKIVYSFMQAVGLVNDHTIDCFRYSELTR